LTHVVFGGRLPRWTGFDVGPVPLRGTRATIHQGQIFGSAGRRVTVAPSYRLVADLEEGAAHTVLPGGSSERRSSRWYASGIGDWLAGGLKRLDVGL
jgi:penicillin amidase